MALDVNLSQCPICEFFKRMAVNKDKKKHFPLNYSLSTLNWRVYNFFISNATNIFTVQNILPINLFKILIIIYHSSFGFYRVNYTLILWLY